MKKIWILCISLAIIFFFSACSERLEMISSEEKCSTLTIEEAKAFINEQLSELILLKSATSGQKKMQLEGDWKNSVYEENEKEEIILTPLKAERRYGFSFEPNLAEFKKDEDLRRIQSLSYYVTIKQKVNKEKRAFILTLTANEGTSDSKLNHNTYLKKEPDFSGIALYHRLDWNMLSALKYTNGLPTHKLTSIRKTGTPTLKSANEFCVTYTIVQWVYTPSYRTLTDNWSDNSGGFKVQQSTIVPGEIYVNTFYYTLCVPDGEEDIINGFEINTEEAIPGGGGDVVNSSFYSDPGGYSDTVALTASTIAQCENDMGVDMGDFAADPVPDGYLIDLRTFYSQGQKVTIDPSGGCLYQCQGRWVYCRNGQYYVDSGDGNWYTATLVTNQLSQELTSIIGRGVTELGTMLARYAIPIEDTYIICTGTDFDGLEQSRFWSAGFLLFSVIPGDELGKALKLLPAADLSGNAARYMFKYGNQMLDLEKVGGVVKFTEATVQELATAATRNGDKAKVMLGKLNWSGTSSYIDRAGSEYKYFNINDWEGISDLVEDNSEEIFRINRQFIENAIQAGNTFYLSHNPFDPLVRTGYYKMELDYIEDIGGIIKPISDNLWMIEF